MELYLRKANSLDKKIVYEWANDSDTRKNSFNTEPIPWENHEKWYQKIMDSMKSKETEKSVLFICMDFMIPVGSVRIDKKEEGIAEISYTVAPDYRGNGYGQKMIILLENEIKKNYPEINILAAEVKNDNLASSRIFEKLEFKEMFADEEKTTYWRKLKIARTEAVQELVKQEDNSLNESADAKSEKKLYDYVATPKLPSAGRQPNFEILRVLAMLMVITLHYLSKGGLLANTALQDNSLTNWLFWTLEAFSVSAVNVYVLISGYFLVDKKFKLGKLAELWCQVFFYSVVVAMVLMLTGIVDFHNYMDLFQIQFFVFPVINGHYWFATAYIMLYLFAPFLGAGVNKLNQRQHGTLILLLITIFSVAKTFIPFELALDDKGYSVVWFLCLFLIAAYYRKYGFAFLQKKGKGFLFFFISVCMMMLGLGIATSLVSQTGKYTYVLSVPLSYNSIFVLCASVALFSGFAELKLKDNALTRFFVRIAPYTFGVYLLHEHLLLRYEWTQWLQVNHSYGMLRLPHLLLSVIIVFTVGIIVDVIRALLFKGIERIMEWGLKLYYSKREIMDYLIFGGLTTVVNWAAYVFCAYFILIPVLGKGTSTNALVSNTIAWIVAVVFAYYTNRKFVFHSEVTEAKALFQEFMSFVGARVFSFLVEQIMFFVMVELMHSNDLVAKLIIGVVVIVLNYIFSKLWIFKKKNV